MLKHCIEALFLSNIIRPRIFSRSFLFNNADITKKFIPLHTKIFHDMDQTTDIVVIGAGITGLTTSHYLYKSGKKFIVLDEKETFGGVISSVSDDGFVYETGPNTGVLSSIEAVNLFSQLDGKTACGNAKYSLETAGSLAKKRYILKDGKFCALPSGLIGGISTKLFTFKDKLRLLGEPFRKRGTNPDETLAEFVVRRMGKSFLDYAINPFVSGVYGGDPTGLVPKYAFPKLYNLEQKYGSLIGGSIKKHREPKPEGSQKVTRATFSAKGGLNNLTAAIFNEVGSEKFIFSAQKVNVQKVDGGFKIKYFKNGEQQTLNCKVVINTAGAFAFSNLFPFVGEDEKNAIAKLKYAGVAECAIGFKKYNGLPLDGFGGLVPQVENRRILGILYMSTLFENRAPKDGALITIFMGGVRHPEMLSLSDFELKQIAAEEVGNILQIKDFEPDLFKVHRHKNAIPQYAADSRQRFEAIEKIEKQFPGLLIGGNMVGGIGMSDRIKQGTHLAEKASLLV